MGAWTTSVDSLLRNLRDALNASVAPMQAVRILDKDLIGYDDWDRFCDLLFNLLVVEPIRSSTGADHTHPFDLPGYETQYESYEDFSLIQATNPAEVGRPQKISDASLFFRFLPSDPEVANFDLVETVRLNDNLTLDESSFDSQSLDDVYFSTLLPEDTGWKLLDEITVNID